MLTRPAATMLILATLAATARAEPRATFVFLGDSITAGEGVAGSENFVGRLAAKHPGLLLLNQGRGGWGLDAYADDRQEVSPAIPPETRGIVIMLGTNDARSLETDEELLHRFGTQLADLVGRLRARAPRARVTLVAPPAIEVSRLTPRLVRAMYSEKTRVRLESLGPVIRTVAREHGCAFVNLFPVVSPENFRDGVHPDAEGHRQIASALGRALF